MTEIAINGRKRSIELSADKFLKHSESITHWVNGGSIEEQCGPDWVSVLSEPLFNVNTIYKPIEGYIQPGEVWIDKEGVPFIATSNNTLQDINGQKVITPIPEKLSDHMIFAASSVEAYFSQKLVKQ